MTSLHDLTPALGTACACPDCSCANDAEIVLREVAMCGCCAADCPDVHEGAWERREALYARAIPAAGADHERTLAMLEACAETDEERAMIRRIKQGETPASPTDPTV